MATERSAEILFKDRSVGVLLETPDGGTRFVHRYAEIVGNACSRLFEE